MWTTMALGTNSNKLGSYHANQFEEAGHDIMSIITIIMWAH